MLRIRVRKIVGIVWGFVQVSCHGIWLISLTSISRLSRILLWFFFMDHQPLNSPPQKPQNCSNSMPKSKFICSSCPKIPKIDDNKIIYVSNLFGTRVRTFPRNSIRISTNSSWTFVSIVWSRLSFIPVKFFFRWNF
jgi:hypothetical protein